MTTYSERAFEDAFALGRANALTIEMARRHCLDMTFSEWAGGGRGVAEAVSGLPINMREVHCPIARGGGAANLEWIATDFYEEHCIGCEHRRPTGEVPNLATIVEARKAKAAAAADVQRTTTESRRGKWMQRTERRRALVAEADPAMAGALDDIGILDLEPGVEIDCDARTGALRRLIALAERAPLTFSAEVMDLAVQLVEQEHVTDLLTPLRQLAQTRSEIASAVAAAALMTLRGAPIIEAGRCIADLADHIDTAALDGAVVRSLVFLAGAPEDDYYGRTRRSIANDPSGLRIAADKAPDTVVIVLRDLLPGPGAPSSIIRPPGTGLRRGSYKRADYERSAAATAVRALAETHQAIAARLVDSLVRNLSVNEDNHYDRYPLASVQHALATLLVLNVGNVTSEVEAAGRSAGDEVRQRLFDVFEKTARLLDPKNRWREPGDPHPTDPRRHALFDQLLGISLTRIGGDWGEHVGSSAAGLIEALASTQPTWAFVHLNALLGAFLTTIDQLNTDQTPPLTVVDGTPPQLRVLESITRRTSIGSTVGKLLDAVEHLAAVDVKAVCAGVADVIADERNTERGPEALWRLLPLLGRIGQRYGDQPGVLRQVLPILHTYMVDSDVALRSAALNAWVEIGSRHKVPSSVPDLLPVLIADDHVGVIRAVLAAARRLTWTDDDRLRLLLQAVSICNSIGTDQTDILKEAMSTVAFLTRQDDRLRPYAEKLILRRAAEFDGYDLEDALSRTWLPETQQTPDMAILRLRQARDPRINDRFNAGDDRELCALLACGAGLAGLPAHDLAAAALDLAPHSPIRSAEYAEVAWRAARPQDAAAIMQAVLDATPTQPAYDDHRALAQVLIDTAIFDAVAGAGGALEPAAHSLGVALDALDAEESDIRANLVRQVTIRATVRFLLAGKEPPAEVTNPATPTPTGSPHDPALTARTRADRLTAAGKELDAVSQRATATGAYLRAFAELCAIAAHLLKFDAAELEADIEQKTAHITAAHRRAALLEAELLERFGVEDPLAGPLATTLAAVKSITSGAQAAAALTTWAAFPMPLLIVAGPRRTRRGRLSPAIDGFPDNTEPVEQPVAVVLASLNGQLITGPQVLRPSTVYVLRLEVHPGQWPEWADRLDGELLSHLTQDEAETPAFSWRRPTRSDSDDPFVAEGSLVLRFGLGAGQPAPPFLVSLRWRGTRDGKPFTQAIDIAGHRELRLRPFDASRDFLTDYPVFDERLLALYERLHHAGYNEDQLQAFCRLFTAICRVGLRITWDKQYKRGTSVKEREFHDDLYERLHNDPELGGRLERGTPLALGFLDVRHDGITAELKVERRTPVSETSAPKYIGQPTQYAAADGARLSILCILDMSPKASPIGTPENYMFTLSPALHGLQNPEAPSLVAVIVVNANQPPPSSWSRRKAAVQPDPTKETTPISTESP